MLEITSHELIKSGISSISKAKERLESLNTLGIPDSQIQDIIYSLSFASDPDNALRYLHALLIENPTISQILDHEHSERLVDLLGISDRLARLIEADTSLLNCVIGTRYESYDWTAAQRLDSMRSAIHEATEHIMHTQACPDDDSLHYLSVSVDALRAEYWKQIISIAAYDSSSFSPMDIQPIISAHISDLVDAALQCAVDIARRHVQGGQSVKFSVIGMGKLGAREINYVSDVDVIYVCESTDMIPTSVAIGTMVQKICQSIIPGTKQPALWTVDTALRPEGKAGALVRTLQAHIDYYEKWADDWEFQALLKARYVAGDADLGEAYIEQTRHFVWSASTRENFVYNCQQMRKRVEDNIPQSHKDREIKLGRGGLRDVEFTIQMLQLVHGRTDESLRTSSTLDSLQALTDGGYISRSDSVKLSHDYRFERVLEHRQQLWGMRRTHLFPDLGKGNKGGIETKRAITALECEENAQLRRLARAVGTRPDQLVEQFDATRRQVRNLHLDIYYRPMLAPISQMSSDAVKLSEQALFDRFASVGFQDPHAAVMHVQALTRGIGRAAKINRILLPSVLQWLSEGQNPDMGLLMWRRLEENFGRGSQYLGFLRDSESAAARLCTVLSNSRYLGQALTESVESIRWLGNDEALQAQSRTNLDVRCSTSLNRFADTLPEFATSIRAMRRTEIERIGLGWLSSVVNRTDSLLAMTDVYDAAIDASVTWALNYECAQKKLSAPLANISVIAMGRYGGREINFSSDADVIMLYESCNGASDEQARAFAKSVVDDVRNILGSPVTREAKIDLDLDLRPEGKNGPLIRSFASCKDYYAKWADMWEHQALLRARHAAGNSELSHKFITEIANPLRYSAQAMSEVDLAHIRTLKARMESERLPRGVKRERHIKLGRGGLSDVEWTVQLFQLMHAHECKDLHTTRTIEALNALEKHRYINSSDAAILRDTWHLATDARNANYLWSGRVNQADILPDDSFSLGGIAACMGYGSHKGEEFNNDLLSLMRKSREIMDRLFYGKIK